jgi:YD repeat-containing protein
MGKPAGPHRRMSVKKRRAAKALGQGASYRQAAKKAGLTSRRALAGVTVAEWMSEDLFRKAVADEAAKAMSGDEWDARNALMARGQIPSRYEWDGEGHLVRATCDADAAMDRQGKALGKFKDPAEQPIAPGSALGAFLGVEPGKLATLAEAAAAVLRSVPKGE